MTITDTQRHALHRSYAWSVNAAVGAGRDELAAELAADFDRQAQTLERLVQRGTGGPAVRRHTLRRLRSRRSAE